MAEVVGSVSRRCQPLDDDTAEPSTHEGTAEDNEEAKEAGDDPSLPNEEILSPRKCPNLSELGASQELLKAISKLYNDPQAIERRPWLLRPVRESRDPGGLPESSLCLDEGSSTSILEPSQSGRCDVSADGHRTPRAAGPCSDTSTSASNQRPRPPSASRVGAPPPAPRCRPGSATDGSQSARGRESSASLRPPRPPPGAPYAAQPSIASLGGRSRRPLSARSSRSQASISSLGATSLGGALRPGAGPDAGNAFCSCTADAVCINCLCRTETATPAGHAGRASDAYLLRNLGRARPKRAVSAEKARQREASAEAAEQEARAEEEKQMKQARIRNWLLRKEEELAARRRLEQEEADLLQEQRELEERRRDEHEAELQRQRRCRLQAAARRRKELDVELECCQPRSRGPCTARAAVPSTTWAAYATPRAASRQRAGSAGSARAGSAGSATSKRARRPLLRRELDSLKGL
eukprot:TRINITY_DN52692_c0_g1_i1.p1 TRINITY_DN52692_c0_g1~~TRINITY_DN52692_c0_g1_i1.p1  ORF type:complete len:467 (-),score=80.79 TRINITY_DN52692_c0_g1_i1:62-1462(-)